MTDRYSLVRHLHTRKRGNDRHCTRSELLLREAVDNAELTVIQYEHEIDNLWYDVAVWYKNRKILIDLLSHTSKTVHERKVNQSKHPIIWIKLGSVGEMLAQIEMWLMLYKERE